MKCRLCDSTEVFVLHKQVDGFRINKKFDIVRCKSCKVAFTHPFLTKKEYEDFHNSHQVVFNGAGDEETVQDYLDNKELYWERLGFNKRLLFFRSIHPAAKNILDIGCGAGFMLDFLSNNDYKVAGIELSPWGHQIATKKLGLDVKNSRIEDLDPPRTKFDIITMYDVIEHTTQPSETLRSIRKWLAKDGKIVMNLPNLDSFISRAAGKHWNKLTPPDHTFHFNKPSITYLLNRSGFKVLNVATNAGSPNEFMSQLAGSTWRLPAKVSKKFSQAVETQNQQYSKNKSLHLKLIKGSKRAANKTGFAAKPILPLLSKAGYGEGMNIVATAA